MKITLILMLIKKCREVPVVFFSLSVSFILLNACSYIQSNILDAIKCLWKIITNAENSLQLQIKVGKVLINYPI